MRRLNYVHWLSLLFLLLLSISGTILALDSRRELSQFNHEVWLTENGLPQKALLQVFELLGNAHPLDSLYRRKLSAALF